VPVSCETSNPFRKSSLEFHSYLRFETLVLTRWAYCAISNFFFPAGVRKPLRAGILGPVRNSATPPQQSPGPCPERLVDWARPRGFPGNRRGRADRAYPPSVGDVVAPEGPQIEFRPAMDRDGSESAPTPQSAPDLALRPESLEEFTGQPQVIANLRLSIQAALLREEQLDHVLLSGLPGLGKTTLAEIVSRELGVGFRATSGPVIGRPADLAGMLMGLSPGDVLFIDEIHRMPTQVEEYLYSAMEDFKLVIVLDTGPQARTVPVTLNPFTLVGATTREGLLSSPFRARFGIHERLEPYPSEDLVRIVSRSARLLDVKISDSGARLLATRARGTPRLVNRYLRRVRDVADVEGSGEVTEELVRDALERLGLDDVGLTSLDRQLLQVLGRAGGPVGLKTIAAAVGEEDSTIEDVYEPFLIREGYLAKTPRGRVITARGLDALDLDPAGAQNANTQGDLFTES